MQNPARQRGCNIRALIEFTQSKDGLSFAVRVIPRSSKSEIVGEIDGALKIKLKAPPVDGAANKELVRFLSKTLCVAKSEIEIISGKASRTKRVLMTGMPAARFTAILQAKMGRDIFSDSR